MTVMTGQPEPARQPAPSKPAEPTRSPAMPAFAVVRDVAASWETYSSSGLAIDDGLAPGLLLYVAGPTDDGIRAIDVWESEEAWRRYQDDHGDEICADVVASLVRRELHVRQLSLGPRRAVA